MDEEVFSRFSTRLLSLRRPCLACHPARPPIPRSRLKRQSCYVSPYHGNRGHAPHAARAQESMCLFCPWGKQKKKRRERVAQGPPAGRNYRLVRVGRFVAATVTGLGLSGHWLGFFLSLSWGARRWGGDGNDLDSRARRACRYRMGLSGSCSILADPVVLDRFETDSCFPGRSGPIGSCCSGVRNVNVYCTVLL